MVICWCLESLTLSPQTTPLIFPDSLSLLCEKLSSNFHPEICISLSSSLSLYALPPQEGLALCAFPQVLQHWTLAVTASSFHLYKPKLKSQLCFKGFHWLSFFLHTHHHSLIFISCLNSMIITIITTTTLNIFSMP